MRKQNKIFKIFVGRDLRRIDPKIPPIIKPEAVVKNGVV